jgi:hypothetical protein
MFDGFDKLPIAIQYAFMIGGTLAGGIVVLWRVLSAMQKASLTAPTIESDLAHQLAMKAAELADMKLRDDLKEVIRISREALEQRMDQAFQMMNARASEIEATSTDGRRMLYQRIDELSREVSRITVEIERLRHRR